MLHYVTQCNLILSFRIPWQGDAANMISRYGICTTREKKEEKNGGRGKERWKKERDRKEEKDRG